MTGGDPQLQQVLQTLSNRAGAVQSDVENELAKVNREMYERNVELAIRNQTLSLLRKIYEIINTSLGLEETAKRLIETIVSELQFQGGAVVLADREKEHLRSISVFRREFDDKNTKIKEALQFLHGLSLPVTTKQNFIIDSFLTRRTRLTNSLNDILQPLVTEAQADKIQKLLEIATLVLYPIIFAGETFGVLVIALDKHVGDLSRAEREALHELIEVVAIAIDRAQLYSDLKDANVKLKDLDKLKDDFVSVASHELRTPMTAIKSYLWMALDGRGGVLTDKQKFYLDRAYNSTDRLIKLVNDMLNISRIESGRMTYDMEKTDLVKLINDVIGDVKPRADELGIIIECENTKIRKDENIPMVLADPDKIKEVLFNLIGNSLKFTPKSGSITISVEQKNTLVQCNVTDTGAGISKEDMEKLFQKFGLLTGSYTINKSDQQGTGLGLYITKSIVEAHSGSISVYSEGVGKGARFSFTLPIFTQESFDKHHEKQEGKEKIGLIHTAM
ncbi:hypothetical protein A3C23_00325 [Candidatus Roizmanbacteria bacterium RIFCSPHIGHO2_02_FULL_37_13b]|uniref:histidine kinase n=1 Tax=Candidatus Roizmanbacteria bacterium RIFCSPLOWO2_02_FULL_36_11 TaxID=1802071 RepID=A0A1F7JBF8_9BACT|nr:MAG: hypothetical protein A3C23_00325 [Candidatus Roizmanbacteria bacterium RIFCSPHIGHO2_02_FULL_37_13b]OGK52948.1 MAG: hypothetical protein A3H78_02435 [Candidatus Roizmanbacteria bacterium RIFCSPLOWO2_02_FULL_36_11]